MFKPEKSKLFLFIFLTGYFLVGWFFVIAPFSTVNQIIKNAPKLIEDNLINNYPKNLIIRIENGQVDINQPSPYCLVLDAKTKFGILFNLDLLSTPDPKDLGLKSSYSNLCIPIAIVSRNYILSQDSDSQDTYQLNKIPLQLNLNIERQTLLSLVNNYLPKLISYGLILYYIAPFLIIISVYSTLLFINLWYAFIVKLFTRLLKIKSTVTFGESYNITLFFLIILTIIDYLIVQYLFNTVFGQNLKAEFPFRNTIFILIISLIYQKVNSNSENQTPQPSVSAPISPPQTETPIIPSVSIPNPPIHPSPPTLSVPYVDKLPDQNSKSTPTGQ